MSPTMNRIVTDLTILNLQFLYLGLKTRNQDLLQLGNFFGCLAASLTDTRPLVLNPNGG